MWSEILNFEKAKLSLRAFLIEKNMMLFTKSKNTVPFFS